VFFAVPQLQRNARDNQRTSYTTRLKAELDTYASNNQGTYPFATSSGNTATPTAWTTCNTQAASGQNCGDWFSRYIGSGKVNIKDPSTGSDATVQYSNSTTTPSWAVGNVWIAVGDKCLGEGIQAGTSTGSGSSRQYAVLTALDRNGTFYCVDNG